MNAGRRRWLAGLACAALAGAARGQYWPPHTPFFATPDRVVDRMLTLAVVAPTDVLYDLGSGDGRIVIAAAKRGAQAVGIDIDPGWTRIARRNAAAAGVADRATFRTGDAFEADLAGATVVTLYLPADLTTAIAPKLRKELRPGTRVVSHEYLLGDWKPERSETLIGDNGRPYPVHLWVAGR
jgi:SAM-dependent methyltransferase